VRVDARLKELVHALMLLGYPLAKFHDFRWKVTGLYRRL
jgi:hypothetical protein